MTSNSAMNSEESSIIPDNLQLQPTEEEQQQQMKIIAYGLAGRQDEIRTDIGDTLNKKSTEQVPTLPAAENLIKKLEELSEEDRNALIKKFGGTRVYRFTKEGEREYVTLQIGRGTEDGRWKIAKQAYDKNGKPKGKPQLFDHPDKIKYREWKLPTADKPTNIGEPMTYRRPDGKLLRGTYDGMDESGIITLKVWNDKIYLNNDNLLAYEHDGKRAFTLRVPARPKPPSAESSKEAGEDASEKPTVTGKVATATEDPDKVLEKGLERAGLTAEQIGKVKKLIEERDAKKGAAPAPAAAAPSG